MLQHELGDHFTFPSGYPDVQQFRQVEMFARVQTVAKHAQVLKMFLNPASSVKLIICTTTFGMGV